MADVTVKLAIGGFSVEVTGEQSYVDKKVDELAARFLSSWKLASGEPPAAAAPPLTVGGKKTSPAEFLKGSIARNQTDRALLLGYYLEKAEGASNFTSSELAERGKDAKPLHQC